MSDNKRVIDVLENYKAYKESKANQQMKFESAVAAQEKKKSEFLNNYYKLRENREAAEREHGKMVNECKDYFFANALKGIYIGALEAATLTDDALFLAENMVDSYIKDKGGYVNIMNEAKVDTYLLAKIRRLVEDAAEEEVKNIEDDKDDVDEIEDIEIQDSPEDEKDSTTVADGEEITTANITDIVQALNQAGMEVVKKDDADNFKDELPETEPDVEVSDSESEEDVSVDKSEDTGNVEIEVEKDHDDNSTEVEINVKPDEDNKDNTTAEPAEDNDESTEGNTEAEPVEDNSTDATEEQPAPSTDVEEAPSTEDKPAESEESEEATAESEEEEENTELDDDLAAAEENNDNEEDDFDDTMDPDSIKVNDDDSSEDDFDDIEDFGDDFEDDDDDIESEDSEDGEDLGDSELEGEESEDDEPIDLDNDGDPDVGDIEEPEPTVNVDPNKTMMDELEDEKEIKDAIELIRTRVADAEEAFIKRNQEDKQQIDDLLSKISHNVATVEKISKEDENSEIAKEAVKESTMIFRQSINKIMDKNTSVFDKMTKNISESIIKDPNKVKMFINESTGNPDMSYIVETAKVMYAFLETLNTLQLENITGSYISNIINNIK